MTPTDTPLDHPSPELGGLEAELGHTFNDPELLRRALLHSSAARDREQSNERYEFLGDRVLGLAIAGLLLKNFPDEDEGKLGYRFSALARAETLARVGGSIGLGGHIVLSEGEEAASGRENVSIIADCCEAVIAALFLDGGLEAAEAFIHQYWKPLMAENLTPPKDAKTMLQEWAQGQGLALPNYKVTKETGPAHEPQFTVEVRVHEMNPASAQGPSKQAAEQAAAEVLMKKIEEAGTGTARTGTKQEKPK
ncbi:MAG: ribonuclease III [Rhodospirillales bacterium]|nr:ribonuclease III [Rhodospirillales bacterium]